MNNTRNTAIAIILAGVIMIIAIVYFVFYRPSGSEIAPVADQNNPSQVSTSTPTSTSTPVAGQEATSAPVLPKPELKDAATQEEDAIKRLCKTFAERFGSFSNQSGYTNINDIKPFMSVKMQAWGDNYIKQQLSGTSFKDYYSITTKALVVNFTDQTPEKINAVVKTQRMEIKGAANTPSIAQKDLKLVLIKEKGEWRVDGASWAMVNDK
jgi:hypothetical protein